MIALGHRKVLYSCAWEKIIRSTDNRIISNGLNSFQESPLDSGSITIELSKTFHETASIAITARINPKSIELLFGNPCSSHVLQRKRALKLSRGSITAVSMKNLISSGHWAMVFI